MRRPEGWCRTAVQRILVRIGVSQDMAALLYDFRDAVAHFDKHPVTVSMTKGMAVPNQLRGKQRHAVHDDARSGADGRSRCPINVIRSAGILPTRGPESAARLWRIVPRG
jgi:hypothetical protein